MILTIHIIGSLASILFFYWSMEEDEEITIGDLIIFVPLCIVFSWAGLILLIVAEFKTGKKFKKVIWRKPKK